jgi:hypothetical protein
MTTHRQDFTQVREVASPLGFFVVDGDNRGSDSFRLERAHRLHFGPATAQACITWLADQPPRPPRRRTRREDTHGIDIPLPGGQILVQLAREAHVYLEDDMSNNLGTGRFNLCDWSEGGEGRFLRHASYELVEKVLRELVSDVAPDAGVGDRSGHEGHV